MRRTTALLALFTAALVPDAAAAAPPTTAVAPARAIELAAVIETDADTLYRMWTTPDGVRTLFPGADAAIGAAVGGEYRVAFDPAYPDGSVNGSAGCKIRELVPGRRVAFEWRGPAWATAMNVTPLPTWVEVDFAPLGDGSTALSLRHHGFGAGPGWDRAYEFFAAAWASTLDGLEQRFAAQPEIRFAAGGEPEQLFVFLLSPGPGWDSTKPPHEQSRMLNHAAYLGSLSLRGALAAAAPFSDLDEHSAGSLALGILRAPDLGTADRYLRADPGVQAGTFVFELRPWHASLSAPPTQPREESP